MLVPIVSLCELVQRLLFLWVDSDVPVQALASGTRPRSYQLTLVTGSPGLGQNLYNHILQPRCWDEVKWEKMFAVK